MASRSRATFAKRQKESARQEKQQLKHQRKLNRKLEKRESPQVEESDAFASLPDFAPQSGELSGITITPAGTAPIEREIQ